MTPFETILFITDKRFKKFESKLFNIVFNYYVDNFVPDEDGKFRFAKNIIKSNQYHEIFGSIKLEQKGLLSFIIKSIKKLFVADTKKFKHPEKKDVFKKLEESSSVAVESQLTDLEEMYREIQQKVVSKLNTDEGSTLKEIREDLKDVIQEQRIFTKYYGRWTHDVYVKYQRIAANELRKKLGLKHAIYQGGEIDTTRDWCDQHNDKVFSEDEIIAWKNQDWQGKNKTNYDPFTDCGGYNCRHKWDWISEQLYNRLK